MQKKISELTNDQIQKLKEDFEVLEFSHDFNVVYENQIPNTGVILIEGEIELTKRSKVMRKIFPLCLLGIHYLINNEQVPLGCKVKKDSKVILIGKSEILEILGNSKSKYFSLFKHLS